QPADGAHPGAHPPAGGARPAQAARARGQRAPALLPLRLIPPRPADPDPPGDLGRAGAPPGYGPPGTGRATGSGMESPRPINPQYDDKGKGGAGIVPDLSARTVVAVFEGPDGGDAAQAAASLLRQRGVSDQDVSLVRRGHETPPAASADDTKAGTGTV